MIIYVDGIEFISLIANLAKNSWSKTDVLDFCELVTKHAGR